MKNVIILLLIATLLSCSNNKEKKSNSIDSKIDSSNLTYVNATIDGNNFKAFKTTSFSAYSVITIAGTSKDKTEVIRIYFREVEGQTTYNLGKGINNANNIIYTLNKKNWIASKTKGKGTITITKKGNYLLGEFTLTAVGDYNKTTKEITNGKFKIKI